ncbi:winged helix-turn-helix transcriptional regulator [Motiliproteus sp.]|uniref:winged helix-turn-helix transcriptional regulator n=1 Tax=Motiliproteus sp. TaxID=1898955 RepID=UPI003BA8C183
MAVKIEHRTRTGCPVACSMDILGDHWTLLVIRNLLFFGVHEFKDMLLMPEKISTSVLTERLKMLEREGLVAQIPHPESARRKLYYLTDMGKDLIHVLTPLVYWADSHLAHYLDIPTEKRNLMDQGQEAFKAAMLAELQRWEAEFLTG